MQPYLFPYIGYFQLINSVDKFIFYDDVNYIKNGWINRNRILLNGKAHYITIPLKKASPFKLILEIEFIDNRKKILKTLEFVYKKAPYFEDIMPLLFDCLSVDTNNISELAITSVLKVCNYLNINKLFENSSKLYSSSKGLAKEKRLIEICKINDATTYINPIGGNAIYSKSMFGLNNIDLFFINTEPFVYKQYKQEFVNWLSIIDVLMFNSKTQIETYLNSYELV